LPYSQSWPKRFGVNHDYDFVKQRVLVLIDTLEIGGAEKSLLEILPRLKTVQPILCHLYPGAALKPSFEQAGVRVISLDLPGKYAFTKAVAGVRELIRAERPALLHSTLMRADLVARVAGRLERVPVINTFVNDTYSPIRWQTMAMMRSLKHLVMLTLDRLTAPLVTRFAANSRAIKFASCKALGVPEAKVKMIYRGRTIARFARTENDKQELRQASGLHAAPILINVARLLDRKGQDDLIRAMPMVLKCYPQALLLIVGEGSYRPALEALVRHLKLETHVKLLGSRNDIPQLLHLSDLFISPSHYEGLPGSVVEAMLSGVPVVLSDTDVHREMVADSETGKLVPLRNVAALTACIVELLDNPDCAREMGARAQVLARELFDIDKVVQQHEQLYAEVLNAR
jgi:glycosyltransferase involved in cell wall biosynthesis